MYKNIKIKTLSKYLAILWATIIVIMSILMIVNYIQIKVYKPIEGNTIDLLVKKLEANPDDIQLREQIRVVDLLARKAYFTSIWQIKTGAWILLGSIILLIVSVKIYTKKDTVDVSNAEKKEQFWAEKSKERNWLIIGVGAIAVLAFALSFNLNSYYSDFSVITSGEKVIEEQQGDSKALVTEIPENNEKQIIQQVVDTNNSKPSVVAASNALGATNDVPSEIEIKKNHPSFRGPWGLGISYAKHTPEDWDGASGKHIVWKKMIELPGLNSPVVWGDFLFIAGANETKRKVFCYNRLTGALIWAKDATNVTGSLKKSPKVSTDTGLSASGLTTDGLRVFAIFATGDLVCLNFKGEQLWAKNLGVPDNHYGYASSLQCYKNMLIIQYDDNKSCHLIALSTNTGDEKWNTKREGSISWSSPIIITKGNSAEIIVNNSPNVASYDAETGKEKWKTNCLSGEIGPSPAYGNGMVFAANEYAKLSAIKDGKVVWEGYYNLPDDSSPVAYKDFLFVTTSYGNMVCYNQKDGSVLWSHEFDNGFYGSPVIADGKLYVIDRTGITTIVEAGSTFNLIGNPVLGEKSDCTPAFTDGMMYVRGNKNLYCIGTK